MESNVITTTPGYLATGGVRMSARNSGWSLQCAEGVLTSATRGVHIDPMTLKPDFPTGGSVSFQERSP